VKVEVGGKRHALAALPPRKKPQYPLYRRPRGPPNESLYRPRYPYYTNFQIHLSYLFYMDEV